jgi:hypothetical protein
MSDKTPFDPVQAQLDAYNAGDVDAFVRCFAPTIVCEDGEGKRLFVGNATMRARYAQLFAESPGLRCELGSRVRVGEYVIDELRVIGREGETVHAVAIYHVRGGVIAHIRFLR